MRISCRAEKKREAGNCDAYIQEENSLNRYVVFGIVGIISGFIASLADVPLVKPGKPDQTLSVNGVNPWWADVPSKRFKMSFWLSFLGQLGTYITMWLLAD